MHAVNSTLKSNFSGRAVNGERRLIDQIKAVKDDGDN